MFLSLEERNGARCNRASPISEVLEASCPYLMGPAVAPTFIQAALSGPDLILVMERVESLDMIRRDTRSKAVETVSASRYRCEENVSAASEANIPVSLPRPGDKSDLPHFLSGEMSGLHAICERRSSQG